MSKDTNRVIIENLRKHHEESLILNPTENIPFCTNVNIDFLEGMYISEEARDENSKVIFGGRENLDKLYDVWCRYMGAESVTFKPHSGLDAHISVFMSLGQIGEKVLLLPEIAGGHFSTHQILSRLGFIVRNFVVDKEQYKVDVPRSLALIEDWKPDYIFVDRSEGLYYEDFSWLKKISCVKVFDASQYLSNIIAEDYNNPFDMGFNIILTSLHKNYPGPQKAAIFFHKKCELWERIMKGLSTYISNIHPKDVYSLLLNLPPKSILKDYSQKMLSVTKHLEEALVENHLPVVNRDYNNVWTQHIWLKPESKIKAYQFFRMLEEVNILTNYRLLPYELGYGLRLGTAAATRQGLDDTSVYALAEMIARVYYADVIDDVLRQKARDTISAIKTCKKI